MDAIIQAKNINLGYKNEIIIKNSSFNIYPKEFVFISGPSGSGKSTLMRSIYGDLPLKSGSLEVCGVEMFKANKKTLKFYADIWVSFSKTINSLKISMWKKM